MGESRRSQPSEVASATDHSTPVDPNSIDELWIEVQRGNRDAFEQLYNQLAPMVYGICLRVLRDSELAQEAAQEAMLQAWKHARQVNVQSGSVKGWVCTIAHRRAVDSVRSNECRKRRESAVSADPTTPFARSESADMGDNETPGLRGLYEALRGLTDLQRQAIEMAYFDGQTYREVAQTLGIPAGTIKTRIRDGLIVLRGSMGVTPLA